MTLIEMMVALTIVVVLFGAVVLGVGALTGAKAKEASTQLAGGIRSLYDTAALTGRTCRMVFDLPGERDEEGSVKIRTECAKAGITAAAKREDEIREANSDEKKREKNPRKDTRFSRLDSDSAPTVQELQEREKARVEAAAKYDAFDTEDVHSITLPSNVRIEVWTAKQREVVKHGAAFLYFFPQGFTERAQLYVRQGTNVWTITVSPLTGKTQVHAEALEVPRS
jgi:general secretion pathway protein H